MAVGIPIELESATPPLDTAAPIEGGIIPHHTEEIKFPIPRRTFLKIAVLAGGGIVTGGIAIVLEKQLGILSAGLKHTSDFLQTIIPQNSESFTYDKAGGNIGASNTLRLTLETINQKAKETDPLTLLFPLKLPEGFRNIRYDWREDIKEINPQDVREPIRTDNKNWMLLSNVPVGTEICAPIDGIAYGSSEWQGFVSGISFRFIYNGIRYTIMVNAGGEFIFPLPTDLPNGVTYAKTGAAKTVYRGETLITMTKPIQILQIYATSTPVDSSKNLETPVLLNFLTTTDKDRIKLLVLSN